MPEFRTEQHSDPTAHASDVELALTPFNMFSPLNALGLGTTVNAAVAVAGARSAAATATTTARLSSPDDIGSPCLFKVSRRLLIRSRRPSGSERGSMTPAELREYCLSFAGAEETFPIGPRTSVFKVDGRMFALSQLGAESLRVSLKCEPELAAALRGAHPAVLPGYHLNKRHWNTVVIDGSLPDDTIRDMVEDSYDLVVSKLPDARRRRLGWPRRVERSG